MRSLKKISVLLFLILLPTIALTKQDNKGDVIAVGQAVYDIFVHVSEDELNQIINSLDVKKGRVVRLSDAQFQEVSSKIDKNLHKKIAKEKAGGAAANTLSGISSLGGNTGLIGIVGSDNFGNRFVHDMKKDGVEVYLTVSNGDKTTTVISLITPDAERTMLVYLGAAEHVTINNLNYNPITDYKMILCEAYMWDGDNSSQAIKKALSLAKKQKIPAAFSLSDEHLVARYRKDFLELLGTIDILFGNEYEMKSLFETNDIDKLLDKLSRSVNIGILTIGSKGAWIVTKHDKIYVPAIYVDKLIDTTGAGDMFAAGFLYGYTHGYSLKQSGELGAKTAAQIIQQVGAKPEEPLKYLLKSTN